MENTELIQKLKETFANEYNSNKDYYTISIDKNGNFKNSLKGVFEKVATLDIMDDNAILNLFLKDDLEIGDIIVSNKLDYISSGDDIVFAPINDITIIDVRKITKKSYARLHLILTKIALMTREEGHKPSTFVYSENDGEFYEGNIEDSNIAFNITETDIRLYLKGCFITKINK